MISELSIANEWWRTIAVCFAVVVPLQYDSEGNEIINESRCIYNAPLIELEGLKYWDKEKTVNSILNCTWDSVLNGREMARAGRGNCLPRVVGPPTVRSTNPFEDREYMLKFDEKNYVVEFNPRFHSLSEYKILNKFAEHEPFYSSVAFSEVKTQFEYYPVGFKLVTIDSGQSISMKPWSKDKAEYQMTMKQCYSKKCPAWI